MAETVSVHVPLVEFRQEGGRFAGYITTPWFRYLVNSNPQGSGSGTGVLHGNPGGAPTWGPVVLTTDVTGLLPVANGGIGDLTRIIGGIPYFPTATTMASSSALAANQLVFGGGASGPSTPLGLGSSGQTLHANPAGAPTWAFTDLTHDLTGVLPVVNGGTGVTTKTGTGNVVLSTSPTITTPTINTPDLHGGTWTSASINGQLFWTAGTVPPQVQLDGHDSANTSVGGVATLIMGPDTAFMFVVYDKTSGGMAAGFVDPHAGVTTFANTLSSVTLSRSVGSGLMAQVTAGVSPRTFSVYAMSTGTP